MVSETKKLAGKVVIITGGGTGMGKAMALMLAKEGADIVVAARRVEPLEQTASEIRALGRRALAVPTDIMVSYQVNQMVERTLEKMGRLDILINNSGIVKGGPRTKPIWDTTDEEWHLHMDTNLTGCFYCCRAAARHFADQKSGKIINISSEAGVRGAVDWYMYPAAKGGVVEITRSLALSLGRYNVQSNCILPGMTDTSAFQPPPPPYRAFW
jgi:NAD(P)-dependent dehydrogenase (short-subunit alcohol dehydrogenase family)